MDARIDALFAAWARPDSPGCAVAVLHDGAVVHSNAYGMADLEFDVPITPATVFHVASLSKQFTGFLTLLLAEDGKLGLDDDIRTHVPEVPKFGTRITLRHLLHHTSGLRDHFTMMKLSGVRPMDEKAERDILELVERQTTLNFRPGTDFNYCNTGYLLLAVAVRRVCGASFRDRVEKRVFQPLGMAASRIRDDHTELLNGRARGYTPGAGGRASYYVPNFDFAGSTSVYTTAEDLLRWAGNVIHPRLGGARVVARLTTPGALNDGRSTRYGAGLEIGAYRGLEVVKHRGWDLGYSAHLVIYPRERFAVAIVGNLSTLAPEVLARRVADIRLADRFPAPLPQPIELPEDALRARAGLYRHPRTNRAHWIHLVDGVLRFGSEPVPAGLGLRPLDATTFRGDHEVAEFVLDGATLAIREESGVEQRLKRARLWAPSANALAEFAGTYRSAELDERVTFRVAGGKLVGKRRRWQERPVAPAYRDAFTDDIATYVFVRNRARRIVAVVLALDRIYHLRFDRVAAPAPRRRPRRR